MPELLKVILKIIVCSTLLGLTIKPKAFASIALATAGSEVAGFLIQVPEQLCYKGIREAK